MKLVIAFVVMCCTYLLNEQRVTPVLSSPSSSLTIDTCRLAQTPVMISTTLFGNAGKVVFLSVHANETTSVAATLQYLADKNGSLIQIQHDTTRLVTFHYQGKQYRFDPNRMFTHQGRMANLRLLNKQSPIAVEKIVAGFADAVLQKLKHASIIVAVHNNTDGGPLSVNSFKQRYVNLQLDADDFVLTTRREIFNQVQSKQLNAVFQTQATSSDDGSLAIYCAKNNIAYINIEAQQGHFTEQLNMLHILSPIFESYNQ